MQRLIAICFALIFVSCISTKAVLIDPSAHVRPKVEPNAIRIIMDEAELDDLEYIKVAMIESTGNSGWTNQTKMIESMRKKAGELGANAILMPDITEPGSGAKIAGAIFGTGAERKGNVIAIFIVGPKED